MTGACMTASLPTYTAVNGHTNGYDYPPRASSTGSSTKALLSRLSSAGVSPPTRVRRLLLFVAVLALSSTLLVYIVFSDALSASTFSFAVPQHEYAYTDDYAEGNDPRSPFFRDAHPALHARLFLARAQAEIRARGLDTCGGQLSAPMVDAYLTAAVPYCVPADSAADNSSSITCFPARAGPGTPNAWWPYPQAFCASRNLAHTEGWARSGEFTGACVVSEGGKRLKGDMGTEGFLGAEFREGDAEGKDQQCGETIKHPVLFVPRQDRWNPFHVGEDLVTTFLALTLFSRHVAPSSSASNNLWTTLPSSLLSSSPSAAIAELQKELAPAAHLQLIFQDDHLPTASLFAPLYDRIGAWTPRRTAADALGMGGELFFQFFMFPSSRPILVRPRVVTASFTSRVPYTYSPRSCCCHSHSHWYPYALPSLGLGLGLGHPRPRTGARANPSPSFFVTSHFISSYVLALPILLHSPPRFRLRLPPSLPPLSCPARVPVHPIFFPSIPFIHTRVPPTHPASLGLVVPSILPHPRSIPSATALLVLSYASSPRSPAPACIPIPAFPSHDIIILI
ncbi:hypothetical protein DFH09DRAFT_1371827 [Mycena vulgaris]|nr:hypothetical protein DFH09DRAFT_1371827 [Mycena vulgaris]